MAAEIIPVHRAVCEGCGKRMLGKPLRVGDPVMRFCSYEHSVAWHKVFNEKAVKRDLKRTYGEE